MLTETMMQSVLRNDHTVSSLQSIIDRNEALAAEVMGVLRSGLNGGWTRWELHVAERHWNEYKDRAEFAREAQEWLMAQNAGALDLVRSVIKKARSV